MCYISISKLELAAHSDVMFTFSKLANYYSSWPSRLKTYVFSLVKKDFLHAHFIAGKPTHTIVLGGVSFTASSLNLLNLFENTATVDGDHLNMIFLFRRKKFIPSSSKLALSILSSYFL